MKTNRILYWGTTGITALMFALSGMMDVLHAPQLVEAIVHQLGYPLYFLTIIGVAKILAVITLLVPRFPRLKEWAYAGLSFNMIGALWSHVATADWGHVVSPTMMLLLVVASYYFYRQVQQPANELQVGLSA